jgi:hypothetical protein
MAASDQAIPPPTIACTVSEAATRLNVSSEEVRRRIRRGDLKAELSKVNGKSAYIVEVPVDSVSPTTPITTSIVLYESLQRHVADLQSVIVSNRESHEHMMTKIEERHRAELEAAKTDADRVRKLVMHELIEAHQAQIDRLEALRRDDLDRAEARHRAEIERSTPPAARRGWFDWLLGR